MTKQSDKKRIAELEQKIETLNLIRMDAACVVLEDIHDILREMILIDGDVHWHTHTGSELVEIALEIYSSRIGGES